MKIFISGIGGSGAYYLAKYYLCKGDTVYGSDIQRSRRTDDLAISDHLYIGGDASEFIAANGPFDRYIYSPAFDETHPERRYFAGQDVTAYDVGQITDKIIADYLSGALSESEKASAIQSELLPLAAIDWSAKKYIAVTGTDGKTTTVSMIYHILRKLGFKAAMISTVGMFIGDKMFDTGFHTTTPSAQELYRLLTSPELTDVEYVILETTSHALAMGRVACSLFDAAAVTNITSEHLDYHKTWDNYFNAKSRLIREHIKPGGVAVLNRYDAKSFTRLAQLCDELHIRYITNESLPDNIILDRRCDTDYNRLNASLAILTAENVTGRTIPLDILSDFVGISGRMEYMQDEPFRIIVDFAHTENALEQVLSSLRAKLNGGRLSVIFGCAGMRDRTKREPMGRIAAKYADKIFIVPEDPRTEKLIDIDRQILSGMGIDIDKDKHSADNDKNVLSFSQNGRTVRVYLTENVDARRSGIADAISEASSGDIVVACGKGHEQSLCFGTTEYPWSDQECIRQILAEHKAD